MIGEWVAADLTVGWNLDGNNVFARMNIRATLCTKALQKPYISGFSCFAKFKTIRLSKFETKLKQNRGFAFAKLKHNKSQN